MALEIPLRELTDVRSERQKQVPSAEAQKVFALSPPPPSRRRPAGLWVLRAMLAEKPAPRADAMTIDMGNAMTIEQLWLAVGLLGQALFSALTPR